MPADCAFQGTLMAASFPKTQFAPVVYMPPETLPVRCRPESLALAGRKTDPRPAVVRLRPVAGGAAAVSGPADVYTARREMLSAANACTGRLIDVYA
jgi:hypothetical protein